MLILLKHVNLNHELIEQIATEIEQIWNLPDFAKPRNHGMPWSDEDRGIMKSLVNAGYSTNQLADKFGRTTWSIIGQLGLYDEDTTYDFDIPVRELMRKDEPEEIVLGSGTVIPFKSKLSQFLK